MPLIVTSLMFTSSEAPSNFEDNVVFTATVTGVSSFPGGPTGTVEFWDGVPPSDGGTGVLIGTVPLVGLTGFTGQAQLQISSLTAGIHTMVAIYSGDANFATSQNYPPGFTQQVLTVPASGGILPGFALIASYTSSGDASLPPQASLTAVPLTVAPFASVILLWDTLNVAFVRIQGNNHVDYQSPPPPGSISGFDTGFISTTGSGVYVVGNGFSATITLTLTTYGPGQVLLAPSSAVTITVT
jgi:hypothetical protein